MGDGKDEVKAAETLNALKGLKVKKSRHFRREILENTATHIKTRVLHKPVKGEKISDTVRKDNKYNPKQVFFAGRAL